MSTPAVIRDLQHRPQGLRPRAGGCLHAGGARPVAAHPTRPLSSRFSLSRSPPRGHLSSEPIEHARRRALNERLPKRDAFSTRHPRGRQGHRRADLHARAHPIGLLTAATCCWRACPPGQRSPCARSATPSTPASRACSSRRPVARRPHGTVIYNSARGDFTASSVPSSPTWCWPTRSTARRPRCRARCWAMQERQVTIGDTTHKLPIRSWSWHPEPHRAGGHLPPARGPGRSLHAYGQGG